MTQFARAWRSKRLFVLGILESVRPHKNDSFVYYCVSISARPISNYSYRSELSYKRRTRGDGFSHETGLDTKSNLLFKNDCFYKLYSFFLKRFVRIIPKFDRIHGIDNQFLAYIV